MRKCRPPTLAADFDAEAAGALANATFLEQAAMRKLRQRQFMFFRGLHLRVTYSAPTQQST